MRFVLAALLATLALPVVGQETVTLPGGASSLTESHGDWTVRCEVRPADNRIGCVVQQEQVQAQSRQRVLAVELVPGADGDAQGTLILPFGLDLDKGASLTVDDGQPMPGLRFRTCLPQGCLVPLAFAPDLLALLTNGIALKVLTVADGGKETPFSVSLNGLGSAVARARELAK